MNKYTHKLLLSYLVMATFILSFWIDLSAQNFVPNPGFEVGSNICQPTIIASEFASFAYDWESPTMGTPDVFNTSVPDICDTNISYTGPLSKYHLGRQFAHTGKRFAGIFTYSNNMQGPSWREYMQVKLTKPLEVDEYYCAEMYISPAENRNYFANNLGMSFHDQPYQDFTYARVLYYKPQVVERNIVTDTAGWVKVGGIFKAGTSARYLTIGNFFEDVETKALFHAELNDNYYAQAYYFIDDILVEKMPYDRFTFSGDTEICKGENVALNANVGMDDVIWTTLSDTSTVIFTGATLTTGPISTTTYRVKARGCNKTVIDTVTITVNSIPDVSLGKDTTICEGAPLVLHAKNEGANYTWQDQTTKEYYNVEKPGTYSVEVTNGLKCKDSDDINVSFKYIPTVTLGNDTLLCGNYLPLDAGKNNADIYNWSTGASEQVIIPTTSGRYWVIVKNMCGYASDTITIYSYNDVFIPNVITPNNDNHNERFMIQNSGDHTWGALNIFDRWGTVIFSDRHYEGTWPKENEQIPSGIYYYTYSYPGCDIYKGWVQVVKGQ